jgi:hypothetical protein
VDKNEKMDWSKSTHKTNSATVKTFMKKVVSIEEQEKREKP